MNINTFTIPIDTSCSEAALNKGVIRAFRLGIDDHGGDIRDGAEILKCCNIIKYRYSQLTYFKTSYHAGRYFAGRHCGDIK